ncbi:MAG: tetratricopeptide repeat protein [Gemmatimonadota bacterium]|nr:tetratricopeptide repeat protein [Gemmatimonadota bacterium]MDH3423222.1 tetratricopeptide repeat protein [Gemmatimonadota bacterium]
MFGRLKLVIVASAAALVLAPEMAAAQDGGRFLVMIPYFQPLEGARDNFGRDASEELRKLMSTLVTHEAMDRGDIEDEADNFDIDMRDLNCLRTIQLSSQLRVPVAICATYTETPDQSRTVNASIRTIEDSEEFVLEPFTVPRQDGHRLAAQQIFAQFDRYNNQVRATAFCSQYAGSQQWEDALRQCDAALAINPEATSTRFLRSQLLRELDRNPESLEEAQRVLAADPFHEGALQLAGYLATVEGDAEAGREYYRQYLDINPGNTTIRMRIAYEQAQAGDPAGAMEFISVGLEVDPENADLNEQFGNFAFTAASDAQTAYTMTTPDAEGLAPEAAQYYRQAIDAYMKVFAARGSEMQEGRLRNILAAHIQLEEFPQAIEKGEQFLQAHSESEVLWSFYADALQRGGQLNDAITALDRVLALNPAHPNAALRQGSWLIQEGRMDEAIAKLTDYVAQNPNQADQAGRMIFADAYQKGYQQEDYQYAIRGFTAAKQVPGLSDGLVRQLNFWHGLAVYTRTLPLADPQTLASAQQTLPGFQEALRLLSGTAEYAQANNINLQQFLDASTQWIEISEMIITRGR